MVLCSVLTFCLISHCVWYFISVKVPYLEAVIREGLRLGNIAPFGLLRSNTEETTLMGFRIPKRSFIVPNFKAVNIDPRLWEEPFKFKPERFLNDVGKLVEPPYFMPFSTGKDGPT